MTEPTWTLNETMRLLESIAVPNYDTGEALAWLRKLKDQLEGQQMLGAISNIEWFRTASRMQSELAKLKDQRERLRTWAIAAKKLDLSGRELGLLMQLLAETAE